MAMFMTMASGTQVEIHPNGAVPSLEDLGHNLARINRFNGALEDPLSVAAHSIALASVLPNKWRMRALLHDASEAVIGDVIKPLKMQPFMQGYRDLEDVWQCAIYGKYGNLSYPDPDEFCGADLALTLYEARLMGAPAMADSINNAWGHKCTPLTVDQQLAASQPLMFDSRLGAWEVAQSWVRHCHTCLMEPEVFCQ